MNTISSKKSSQAGDRKGDEIDHEKIREKAHNVTYQYQEKDTFDCWVNGNSTSGEKSGLIQNCGNEKNEEKEMNVLKSLWNKDMKTSINDDSKKSPLDTLLKYKYMDEYMSSIFDMRENENERKSEDRTYNEKEDELALTMKENEKHKKNAKNITCATTVNTMKHNSYDNTNDTNDNRENKNEHKRKETSFFHFYPSDSSSVNEKEKEDADRTCEIEGLEKDYISFVHSTQKTEEDDVLSARPTEFSSFYNEPNTNFNKSRTDYVEGIYNGSFEDNDLMQNFVSLDLNNSYRNNLQKLNSDDDIFNLLIKNKKAIDREYAEINKRQETSDYSPNVSNFDNTRNVDIVPNFHNSQNKKLAFINNNVVNSFDPIGETEEISEQEILAALENNGNKIQQENCTYISNTNNLNDNEKNAYNEGDCNNINKIRAGGSLPKSMGMNEKLENTENSNLLNFLNEWNNEYSYISETNKKNQYVDVILEHLYQGKYIKNIRNRDSNVSTNENPSVDYNIINSKYSTGNNNNINNINNNNNNNNPSANVHPIPNASPITASLLSSLNYKNDYFLNDMIPQKSDNLNVGENSIFIQNGTVENNTYPSEPLYRKYKESMHIAHNIAQGQYVLNSPSVSALKSTDGNIYVKNKSRASKSFSQMRNNNNNEDNPSQSQILQMFKTMLIDLIEREDNDIGLFECIVTAIHEYHKYKKLKETAPPMKPDRNTNELYNIVTNQYGINDAFFNTVSTNNYTGGSIENCDSPNIYSLINENPNETNAMQNPLHSNTHSMLKSKTVPGNYFGDNSEVMTKSAIDEYEIYDINNSTTPNSYFRELRNQLNTSGNFEKEQLILSQLKKERANVTEENKLMTEESKEEKRGNRYTNGNTSAVKFHLENKTTEGLKRFQDEIRANTLPENMDHIREEKKRHMTMTMNQTNTNATGNFLDDENTYNDTSDNEEKQKWDFHNTFGGQSSTMRNLKSFFSNSVPKNDISLHDDSTSGVLNGNTFMNRSMNISELNNFSKHSKTSSRFNWDQSNSGSLTKNKRSFRNDIYKKKKTFNTFSGNNHSDTYGNDSGYDIKRIYKSDSVKPTIKSKSNGNIKKLSAEELKGIITKEDEDCLRCILESLYEDRILPLLFNLNGRAEEKKCREVIKNNLITAYSLYPDEYNVKKTENGDDYLVLFTKKTVPDNYFIYLNNLEDNYGETMWKHFTAYLEEIAQSDEPSLYEFSGGRYGMAKELKNRNLFFFKDFCLGELCHIVHLSTNKKLIAYEQNFLKPISKCYKYTNAKLGQLSKGEGNLENYITTIDELKYYMKALLKYYKGGFNISTLKKKMKTRFNKQICESVFHCIKLIEVLQLDELKDICVIDKDLKFIQAV